MKRSTAVALLIFLLLLVDQIVKIWVKTSMTLDEHIPVFGSWFIIRFIENPGAAFGMELPGAAGKLILSLFRVAAVGVLGWLIFRRFIPRGVKTGVVVGFTLILAGAAGNIFDSAFYGMIFSESTYWQAATLLPEGGGYAGFLHGRVVDMLYFPVWRGVFPAWMPGVGGDPFTFFSPIFNIADSYITCGMIYLLIFQQKFFK